MKNNNKNNKTLIKQNNKKNSNKVLDVKPKKNKIGSVAKLEVVNNNKKSFTKQNHKKDKTIFLPTETKLSDKKEIKKALSSKIKKLKISNAAESKIFENDNKDQINIKQPDILNLKHNSSISKEKIKDQQKKIKDKSSLKNVIEKNDSENNEIDFENSEFIKSKEETLYEEVLVNAPKKRKNSKDSDEPQLSVQAILQGALYIAGKEGMTLADFHKILPKLTTDEIRRHLMVLQNKLANDVDSGIALNDFGGKYKLLTKKEIKKEMQRYANVKFKNPLNSKLMEVLAIIAYNQPCTRPRISEIRGVESAPLVDILIDKGLVVELGRADTWGRPFIYEVSQKFFDLFGITKIEELPEVQDFDIESFQESNFFDSNRFED